MCNSWIEISYIKISKDSPKGVYGECCNKDESRFPMSYKENVNSCQIDDPKIPYVGSCALCVFTLLLQKSDTLIIELNILCQSCMLDVFFQRWYQKIIRNDGVTKFPHHFDWNSYSRPTILRHVHQISTKVEIR